MKQTRVLYECAIVGCLTAGVALTLAMQTQGAWMGWASRALLLAAVVGAILYFARKERGRARAHDSGRFQSIDAQTVTADFSRVAANEEALSSLREICDFLKAPEKYARLGVRMPRGVLLYGPPGTGKTLLARALAGEAGTAFFALNGSDFVQLYVGVGTKRVRELFQNARKAGRAVIFIDEIDAIGKRRDDMASEEREQTLNALLSEMSGFQPTDGIVVVAATNRVDTLDPALLRPGRFDRRIEVGLPGYAQRRSILQLLCADKPVEHDVNMDALARMTVTMSGASLETLVNEAAILAVRRGADAIAQDDLERAFVIAVAGGEKPSNADSAERATIALHEAGHALATRKLMPDNALTRVTILPSGHGAAGYSMSVPPERQLMRRDQLFRQMEVLLAGRAAEALIEGDEHLSGGAMNDLARATEIAARMALDMGLVREAYISYGQLRKFAGAANDGMTQAIADTLRECYERVTALLAAHTDALMAITGALLERETLSGAEIDEILQK